MCKNWKQAEKKVTFKSSRLQLVLLDNP